MDRSVIIHLKNAAPRREGVNMTFAKDTQPNKSDKPAGIFPRRLALGGLAAVGIGTFGLAAVGTTTKTEVRQMVER